MTPSPQPERYARLLIFKGVASPKGHGRRRVLIERRLLINPSLVLLDGATITVHRGTVVKVVL